MLLWVVAMCCACCALLMFAVVKFAVCGLLFGVVAVAGNVCCYGCCGVSSVVAC